MGRPTEKSLASKQTAFQAGMPLNLRRPRKKYTSNGATSIHSYFKPVGSPLQAELETTLENVAWNHDRKTGFLVGMKTLSRFAHK